MEEGAGKGWFDGIVNTSGWGRVGVVGITLI